MSDLPVDQPTRLGHVLQRLVRKRGIAEESAKHDLNAIWNSTAGGRVASKSFVRRLRGGVLEIGVTNGAILEELTCYLQHELLPALQQQHPTPEIHSLKFVKVN